MGYLGDGWCDGSDAPWGIDLTCYDCDNGDCSGDCGCELDIPAGDCDCDGNVLDVCGECGGDGVDADEDGICDDVDDCVGAYDFCGVCNGDNVCDDAPAGCDEGTVDDCSGDGDCCSESWIGDGYCDGEDQAYGCDLTCYEGETECGGGDPNEGLCYDDVDFNFDLDGDGYVDSESICDYYISYQWYFGYDCAAITSFGYDCADVDACGGCDAPEGCADGQWECNDGGCIPAGYYCDGSAENGNAGWGPDCADGSDEVLEDCCAAGEYDDATCGGGSGDPGQDCADAGGFYCGDDESNWTSYSPGGCVPSYYICDGWEDCVDAGDEADCGGRASQTATDKNMSKKYASLPNLDIGNSPVYDRKMAEFDAANESSRDSACDGSWSGSDFGCDGVCFSGLEDVGCGCGDPLNEDGCCGDETADCYGACGGTGVDDCVDDSCHSDGWVGDGYCDGTDQAYGADLLCYDCDGGDCMGACGCEDDSSCNDCCDVPNGDNSTCGGSGDVNGGGADVTDIVIIVDAILEVSSLDECSANEADVTGDGSVNVLDVIQVVEMILAGYTYGCTDPAAENYDAEADADDGSCTYPCPDGYIDDCADDDCCPESWVGDGFDDCEDQAYGCDLTCYDNDGGDCYDCADDGLVDCGDGTCVNDASECANCADTFTVAGSDGENDCYSDGSGYFVFDWDGGCLGTYIVYDDGSGPAEMDISSYGFTDGFIFYGFAPGTCFDATISFDDGSSVSGSACVDCNEAQSCADTTCGYYLNYGYTCDDLAYYSIDCSACDAEGACDAPAGCSDSQFDCYGDGSECISSGWYCDGSSEFCNASWPADCSNGADEGLDTCGYTDDCAAGCADDEFTCNDGTCIPGSWECDVNWCDCPGDACEDEANCGGGDECVNDDSTSDSYGDTCSSWYDTYESEGSGGCNGNYNDDDFDAAAQCCVCGGGSTGGRDVSLSNNLKLDFKLLNNNQNAGPQIEGDINMIKKTTKNPADVIQSNKAPLGRKASQFESKLQRAESVKLIQTAEGMKYEADGYVGFEITLEHGADFTINVTESSFIADYATTGNTTKVIIVGPETENLFSSTGDYTVVDVIAGTAGGTALSADIVSIPTVFGLNDAYPNPFNPTTSVELAMPQDGFVSVKVYNLMGQVVATLHEGNLTANSYSFTWDAADVASGMYLLKAETAGSIDVQKIMLMK
jgi:hypothetical protein